MGMSGKTNKVSSGNDGHGNNIIDPILAEGRREENFLFSDEPFF